MPDRLQVKRGLREALPETALEGEILLCTDTKELFVGINGRVEPIKIESDSYLTSSIPVPQDIGGIKKGKIFDKTLISDVLLELLYPYTPPDIALTTNQSNLIESGLKLNNTTCTIKILKRMYNIETVSLYKSGRLLQTWGNIPSTFTTPVTLTYSDSALLSTDTTYSVQVTDEKQSASKSTIISFELPVFLGACADTVPTSTEINRALKSIKNKASLSNLFTTNNQRMLFVYPYSWGELASIKDTNQFDITNTFSKQIIMHSTSAGSNKYYAYTSNITTVKSFKVNFNF